MIGVWAMFLGVGAVLGLVLFAINKVLRWIDTEDKP